MSSIVYTAFLYFGVVGIAWGLIKDNTLVFLAGSFCLGVFAGEVV